MDLGILAVTAQRRDADEIPLGHPIRGAICGVAANEALVRFSHEATFGMFELGILTAGVRQLIIDASQGVCRLWKTKTRHVKGREGQQLYQICPAGDDCDIFVEFKITLDQKIWVISVHEDSEKGKYR